MKCVLAAVLGCLLLPAFGGGARADSLQVHHRLSKKERKQMEIRDRLARNQARVQEAQDVIPQGYLELLGAYDDCAKLMDRLPGTSQDQSDFQAELEKRYFVKDGYVHKPVDDEGVLVNWLYTAHALVPSELTEHFRSESKEIALLTIAANNKEAESPVDNDTWERNEKIKALKSEIALMTDVTEHLWPACVKRKKQEKSERAWIIALMDQAIKRVLDRCTANCQSQVAVTQSSAIKKLVIQMPTPQALPAKHSYQINSRHGAGLMINDSSGFAR